MKIHCDEKKRVIRWRSLQPVAVWNSAAATSFYNIINNIYTEIVSIWILVPAIHASEVQTHYMYVDSLLFNSNPLLVYVACFTNLHTSIYIS